MGGALALAVARAVDSPAGAVLLAPMLASAASPLLGRVASFLAWTPLARLALVASNATSNEKQYADPAVRRAVDADELAYKGNLRVASVASVLSLGAEAEASLAEVSLPFLCCLAEREMVLGPEVVWLCMLAAALAKCFGAARYPRRQPVIANALLNPFTVSVRSRMPGRDANETCLAGG